MPSTSACGVAIHAYYPPLPPTRTSLPCAMLNAQPRCVKHAPCATAPRCILSYTICGRGGRPAESSRGGGGVSPSSRSRTNPRPLFRNHHPRLPLQVPLPQYAQATTPPLPFSPQFQHRSSVKKLHACPHRTQPPVGPASGALPHSGHFTPSNLPTDVSTLIRVSAQLSILARLHNKSNAITAESIKSLSRRRR